MHNQMLIMVPAKYKCYFFLLALNVSLFENFRKFNSVLTKTIDINKLSHVVLLVCL